jgi:hypothetical protein
VPGRRDLDEQVGPVHLLPQRPRLGDGRLGVVGVPRVHLDRHPPVQAIGGVVHRPQHVTGPAHVVGGHRAHGLVDAGSARPQVIQLSRVLFRAGRDRLGEDRRVGGHPDHVIAGDQVRQAAGGQPPAAQVIEPDRDAAPAQVLEWISHDRGPFRARCAARPPLP